MITLNHNEEDNEEILSQQEDFEGEENPGMTSTWLGILSQEIVLS